MFVCLNSKNSSNANLPIFGKIEEIVIIRRTSVFFAVSVHDPEGFDPHLHAYSVQTSSSNDRMNFVNVEDLADYRPLSVWTPQYAPGGAYLSFHHLVV